MPSNNRNRDNFSASVIKAIQTRVCFRCSNPACRVPTAGPKGGDKSNIIGIAAHISAAAPLGPRYSSALTANQRKSIQNAIWLCVNCSVLIDKDPDNYPTELLIKWKESAEKISESELGKKLPSQNELVNAMSAMLSGSPKDILVNAIPNTHASVSSALEYLDKRIKVITTYDKDGLCIELLPKEKINLELDFLGGDEKEYIEKSKSLFEHGKDLCINTNKFSLRGSPLIEEIFRQQNGLLTISPEKKAALMKIAVIDNKSGTAEQFYDIHGYIFSGNKSATFKGEACNGVFSLETVFNFTGQSNFTVSIGFEKWNNLEITKLPYFEKIFNFSKKLITGNDLQLSLEINGLEIINSISKIRRPNNQLNEIITFLYYTHRCIKISKKFNISPLFNSNSGFTEDDHKNIAEIVSIIDLEKKYYKKNFLENPKCTLTVQDPESFELINEKNEEIYIRIDSIQTDSALIFGKEYALGDRNLQFNSVRVFPNDKSPKKGDSVVLELIPTKNTIMTFYYGDPPKESQLTSE